MNLRELVLPWVFALRDLLRDELQLMPLTIFLFGICVAIACLLTLRAYAGRQVLLRAWMVSGSTGVGLYLLIIMFVGSLLDHRYFYCSFDGSVTTTNTSVGLFVLIATVIGWPRIDHKKHPLACIWILVFGLVIAMCLPLGVPGSISCLRSEYMSGHHLATLGVFAAIAFVSCLLVLAWWYVRCHGGSRLVLLGMTCATLQAVGFSVVLIGTAIESDPSARTGLAFGLPGCWGQVAVLLLCALREPTDE